MYVSVLMTQYISHVQIEIFFDDLRKDFSDTINRKGDSYILSNSTRRRSGYKHNSQNDNDKHNELKNYK